MKTNNCLFKARLETLESQTANMHIAKIRSKLEYKDKVQSINNFLLHKAKSEKKAKKMLNLKRKE